METVADVLPQVIPEQLLQNVRDPGFCCHINTLEGGEEEGFVVMEAVSLGLGVVGGGGG